MRNQKDSILRSRRDFLKTTACAAMSTAALTGTIRDLRLMNAAVAQSNISDYKALVCVFLAGGNDSNNMIIPHIQSEYNNYAAIRSNVLALPRDDTMQIFPGNSDGHEYELHPAAPQLRDLFNAGKLAVLFNAGTLVYPMTKAQYNSGFLSRPPQLFSHADQVTQWQTSIPDRPPLTGWGGRCADLLNSVQPNAPISMTVTLNGANTFEVGNIVAQYSVSTTGAVTILGVSGARLNALTGMLGLNYPNMQAQAYSSIALHSIVTATNLNNAIVTNGGNFFTNGFPTTITSPTGGNPFSTQIGNQLKMIARLIEAGHRSTTLGGFGMKRQIFFCQIGGFDNHTNQTPGPGATTIGNHANLLADLSQCLNSFQLAMEQIGLSQKVTVFTASDFGRTFPCNGQGTDHGWGSHHLILGGAVKGGKTYGTFPTLTVGGPDDTSTGRWIPTTAIDQYYATLATWFGVDNSNLSTVFPNLGRFATPNLGFV
jgi:uncharacterized protein (DUF1501 family)